MSGSSPSADVLALLEEIESFLKDTGLKHHRFGELAANNPYLVMRLRAGSDVKTATAERVRRFMRHEPYNDGTIN